MSKRGVYFVGIEDIEKKLKENVKMDAVKEIVKRNASQLQLKMMRGAPVDTGFLKRSIVFNLSGTGLTGTVGIEADYAPFLIYGTRYMAKQDFFRPNFKSQSQQFTSDLDRLVK